MHQTSEYWNINSISFNMMWEIILAWIKVLWKEIYSWILVIGSLKAAAYWKDNEMLLALFKLYFFCVVFSNFPSLFLSLSLSEYYSLSTKERKLISFFHKPASLRQKTGCKRRIQILRKVSNTIRKTHIFLLMLVLKLSLEKAHTA